MKIITFSSFVGFGNRGAEALLKTRIKSIRKLVPGVKFYVLSIYTETCKPIKGVEYINTFGGKREKLKSFKYIISSLIKGLVWTFNVIIYRFFGRCFNHDVRKIAGSDIFVSTDGDVLGEDYGLLPFLWRIYFLSLGLILKKPVIIYAEGAGPFKSALGRFIAKNFFNKCAYISVREKISLKNIKELKVNKKVDLVADSAFLLEASSKKFNFRKKGRKLIGFALSKLVTSYKKEDNFYEVFLKKVGETVDWVVEELKADIILIPHVIQPERDDFQTAKDILKKVKNKKHVKILGKNLNAADFKKIISTCDLIITSRLHPAIAALSFGIPAISIAYSHKISGIYNFFGLEDLIFEIENLNWLDLRKKITNCLINSEKIERKIKIRLDYVKKLAQKPAFEVKKFLENEK